MAFRLRPVFKVVSGLQLLVYLLAFAFRNINYYSFTI